MNRTFRRLLRGAAAGIFLALYVSCTSSAYSKELHNEYFTIAREYGSQKNYKKAIEYYKKARAGKELSAAASYEIARLHIISKEYAAAEAELQLLLKKEPDNGLLLSAQAYVLACLNRYPESIDCYRKLQARNELELSTGRNFLSLLYTAGYYDEMQAVLQQFFSLYPDDEGLAKLDILYGLRTGRENGKDDAVAWLQRDSNGTDPAVLTALAEYYAANGQYEDALNIYSKLTAEYKTPDILLEMSYLAYDKVPAPVETPADNDGVSGEEKNDTPKTDTKDPGAEYLAAAVAKITDETVIAAYLERLSPASREKAETVIADVQKKAAEKETPPDQKTETPTLPLEQPE